MKFFRIRRHLSSNIYQYGKRTDYFKKVLSELRQIKNLLFENKTVLNVEELAQYTGLSKSKIYKLLSKKLIPTGTNANIRQKFFYKKDIDLWLMGTSEEELEAEEEFNSLLSRNRKS